MAVAGGYCATMNLLAIDTALEACSVGVAAAGNDPVLISETIGRGHAERLFGMIESAMAEAGLAYADLDRIAVTVGPGSFTGLRVGIAAARGLALVIGCPVVGIGTLAVIAASAREAAGPVPVWATLDARRDEVYVQSFDAAGKATGEAEAGPAARFAAAIEPETCLAGPGAPLVASAGAAEARIVAVAPTPDIGALVRLGLAAMPPFDAPRPLYVRAPDAKPQSAAAIARR
ncbi:tRNA (adenosine(37)-N6)-threonylcarbamoyltransferase complex dimerization subunit type 1 TsaB [Bauldia litoralis]|uniref:tRNA (adenosine(37)-N6)-threonylcarbamoyltransferase complex dimerization subunit type 1 TsaB n=1 Tax=Bauldia litoralis TaxID=665467 RepID=UPI0032998B5A